MNLFKIYISKCWLNLNLEKRKQRCWASIIALFPFFLTSATVFILFGFVVSSQQRSRVHRKWTKIARLQQFLQTVNQERVFHAGPSRRLDFLIHQGRRIQELYENLDGNKMLFMLKIWLTLAKIFSIKFSFIFSLTLARCVFTSLDSSRRRHCR